MNGDTRDEGTRKVLEPPPDRPSFGIRGLMMMALSGYLTPDRDLRLDGLPLACVLVLACLLVGFAVLWFPARPRWRKATWAAGVFAAAVCLVGLRGAFCEDVVVFRVGRSAVVVANGGGALGVGRFTPASSAPTIEWMTLGYGSPTFRLSAVGRRASLALVGGVADYRGGYVECSVLLPLAVTVGGWTAIAHVRGHAVARRGRRFPVHLTPAGGSPERA